MIRGSTRTRSVARLRIALLCIAGLLAAGCGSGALTGTADRDGGGVGGLPPGAGPTGDWQIEVVDDNANAGQMNTLRMDASGRPVVAYFASAGTVYWVRYATYDGWSWEIETVHETDTETGCSLAMRPSGEPSLSFVGGDRQPLYYWPFQSDLLLATWEGAGWGQETVDEEGVVGLWASVAYDGFGQPAISYQDLGNGIDYNDFHLRDLKYAYRTPTGWESETVETDGGGYYTQLVFDEDEQPAIAYCGNLDGDTQPVKLARRGDYGWEVYTVDAAGKCVEASLSARALPGGGVGLAFYDDRFQDLKYATLLGGIWHVETVEAHNKVGKYCSLAYDADGRPVISYYYCGRSTDSDCQGGGDLRVAWRTQTGWRVETVESEGNTGLFTSLEVSALGHRYIAYHDRSLGVLKMAVQR